MNTSDLTKLYLPLAAQATIDYQRQLWEARFSPCGKYLVAGGYDATIQRWDISGEEPKQCSALLGHNGWVQCLGFAPENERLFTADSWGRLMGWPYADDKPAPLWNLPQAHDGWIRALAVSPDGKSVATGGNDLTIRIHSTADGSLQKELKHPSPIFSLCFHPEGTSLVSGDLEGGVRHWDLGREKVIRQFDAGILYNQHRIQQCGGVRRLSFDAQGRFLACSGQKDAEGGFAKGTPCVLLFDWKSGKQVRELLVGSSADGFAYDAQFHSAGFLMCVACAMPKKGQLQFWNPEDDKAFYVDKKLTNGRTVSVHPDGRRLAMLASDSGNRNGRPDGEYSGGSAAIHLLQFPEAPSP
jgi:WD40 repeat protein